MTSFKHVIVMTRVQLFLVSMSFWAMIVSNHYIISSSEMTDSEQLLEHLLLHALPDFPTMKVPLASYTKPTLDEGSLSTQLQDHNLPYSEDFVAIQVYGVWFA